jgi:hypothetical protein
LSAAVRTGRGLAARLELPLPFFWLACGFGLSEVTRRVTDWFVMPDELFYERLGISVGRFHSLVPRVHGVFVPNVNQLYPILLGAVYRNGYVPESLRAANVLNAFVMTSAAIPAFLLARRVTGSRLLAYLVAVLTAFVPWILYSMFLLTEVVSYPAFLWAVLGIQAAMVAPSRRRDVVALAGLALAVLARTEFVVLVLLVPVLLVAYELAQPPRAGAMARLGSAAGGAFRKHRLLGWFYAALVLGGVALVVTGHAVLPLGTYGGTLQGHVLAKGTGRSLLDLVEILVVSVGIVPFVLGLAWLLASVARPAAGERYAFALVALISIAVVTVEVAIFDARFGAGVVHDRYVFYVVPLVLIGFAATLGDTRWPRRSLLVPTAVAGLSLALARLPVAGTLNVDSAVSRVNLYLVASLRSLDTARATLVVATLVSTVLFVQASALLPRRLLAPLLAVFTLGVLVTETEYEFAGILENPGSSGRPLTLQQGNVFDWVDRTIGTRANVTMVPYPSIDGDYGASIAYWWDMEFWNISVDRAAYVSQEFEGTPTSFPRLALRFNPQTGIANIAPTHLVIQLADDSRFRIEGSIDLLDRGALLIDTGGHPWQASWMTLGLYDDGWTKPNVTAQIRVFPTPGQSQPETRTLRVELESTADRRPVEISSNAGRWKGDLSASQQTVAEVPVCQPAHGHTDIRINVQGASPIHGDMRNITTFLDQPRRGGIYLASIDLEGNGPGCDP